tara:strand:- start:291 stop:566 length:276 start_codon:yes stop_codon:yes gene_type:complete
MGLIIKIQKYIQSNITDTTNSDFSEKAINYLLDSYSSDLSSKLKNVKCPNHPNSTTGIIKISSNSSGKIFIEKTNFCCVDFEENIVIPHPY